MLFCYFCLQQKAFDMVSPFSTLGGALYSGDHQALKLSDIVVKSFLRKSR